MIHLKDIRRGSEIFKALGSDIRLEILSLLSEYGSLNINEIAGYLQLTQGALTSHIKMLNEADLIEVSTGTGKKGTQKICRLSHDTLIADFKHSEVKDSMYELELDIGLYFNYSVCPTCGLATTQHLIGNLDDPRYFTHPERVNAGIIWFSKGFIEYRVPNFLKPKQKINEIKLSFEICSEAPGVNENWPSDIHFFLNDKLIGIWTSPGDFGENRGFLTPSWWHDNLNQYGLLKMLTIGRAGSFIDGIKISDTTADDLSLTYQSDLTLRLSVPEDTMHCGGLTIFGKGFGNYNQGIRAQVFWENITDQVQDSHKQFKEGRRRSVGSPDFRTPIKEDIHE